MATPVAPSAGERPPNPNICSGEAWAALVSASRTTRTLEPTARVQEDRDGAVVDEIHFHHGAEAAGGDLGDAGGARLGDHRLVEALGLLRLEGVDEGRAPALARVAVEGELRDDEEAAAGLEQR